MFYLLRSVAQMSAAGNEGEESEKLLKDSETLSHVWVGQQRSSSVRCYSRKLLYICFTEIQRYLVEGKLN